MKTLSIYLVGFMIIAASVESWAQGSARAGAFARVGFGARGMAMGNAMTAIPRGHIQSYYNPALVSVGEERVAGATFGVLSWDRYLNFLSYTQSVKPTGGLSLGLINAGVRKIDGRDNDGYRTEDLSVTENQFYLAFANRMHERFSLGVTVKLYYARLYDEIASSTVGFDVGAFVKITEDLTGAIVLQDISSKYKWDTSPLYDRDGKQITDKFPLSKKIGLAYSFFSRSGIVALDVESRDGVTIIRSGAEYEFSENFTLRGGIDRWMPGKQVGTIQPSVGFDVRNSFNSWTPALSYACILESFSPEPIHIITLSLSL